jgi:hypothetical protein
MNPKQAAAIAIAQKQRQMQPAPQTVVPTAPLQQAVQAPVARVLPPALQQRAQMVKQAHRHLTATVPGFAKLPLAKQMPLHQAHIRKIGR